MADTRDEFLEKDKIIIAKRSGYLCSFPGCGAITISSSDESETSISSSGMACHISAAASGKNARRYDENLSSEQRKHPNNGIWMCYKHGKIIDTDEYRFTTETLIYWKKLSEKISRLMHEKGIEYSKALQYIPNELAPNKVTFNELKNENQLIGDALVDSCIPLVWGDNVSNSIRDFLIEISRNSMTHGRATELEIKFEHNKITLFDNGVVFDLQSLKSVENGNGGQLSLTHLLERYGDELIITYRNENGKNATIITKLANPEDILEITPCAIQLTLTEYKWGVENYTVHDSCTELFVVLPKYFTLSDFPRSHVKDKLLEEKRPITFIGENLSEMVLITLVNKFPNAKIINVK